MQKFFFYATSMTFAIISGIAESYLYHAYLPNMWFSWPEAIARSTITQVAIIFFGIAVVVIYEKSGGGFVGFLATIPVNIGILLFSLVAFWFTRESALMFADSSQLVLAQSSPIDIFGIHLDGKEIDPDLIASLPFFQVFMTWLAPFIVADRKEETIEELKTREEKKLLRREYAMKRLASNMKGGADALRQGFQAIASQKNDAAAQDDDDIGSESGDVDSEDTNKGSTANSEDHEQQNDTPANTDDLSPDRRIDFVQSSDVVNYCKRVLHREISLADALAIVRDTGNNRRDRTRIGHPYIAPKLKAYNEARRRFPAIPIQEVEQV